MFEIIALGTIGLLFIGTWFVIRMQEDDLRSLISETGGTPPVRSVIYDLQGDIQNLALEVHAPKVRQQNITTAIETLREAGYEVDDWEDTDG